MKQILDELDKLYNRIDALACWKYEHERCGNESIYPSYFIGKRDAFAEAAAEINNVKTRIKNIIPLRNTIKEVDLPEQECICHIIHEVCDFCNNKLREEEE